MTTTRGIVIAVILMGNAALPAGKSLVYEKFNNLSAWKDFYFRGIEKRSRYRIVESEGGSYLEASAEGSASALVMKRSFDVYRYPLLRWRWKIRNVHQKGNAAVKRGDDYPLRVYVLFDYRPAGVPLGLRIRYRAIRLLYGRYPPHSSLNYIWANRKHSRKILTSPYSDRVRLYILRAGNAEINTWKEESVNIIRDYQLSFREKPPRRARIAIMADGDNTGGSVLSFIDNLEISSENQ